MTKEELLEIIRQEIQNVLSEDEYDYYRDTRPFGSRRGGRTVTLGADIGGYSKPRDAAKDAMMQQKVKYKDTDGTDREATVKSLLSYDKNHPGRKAAARIYAQYMAKAKQKQQSEDTTISEHSPELDERTVASREPPRKMTKDQVKSRDSIGKKMLKNKRSVRYFKDKFGDDWKSYLWAVSTNKSIDSKKKK